MTNQKNEIVSFGLKGFETIYSKRVLNKWGKICLLFLVALTIDFIVNGYTVRAVVAFTVITLTALLYGIVTNKSILYKITHNTTTDIVEIEVLKYNKAKRKLLASRKELKFQVRKRYRYRYPPDCLLILHHNKEIYVQEETPSGWTKQQFDEIEKYFKSLI